MKVTLMKFLTSRDIFSGILSLADCDTDLNGEFSICMQGGAGRRNIRVLYRCSFILCKLTTFQVRETILREECIDYCPNQRIILTCNKITHPSQTRSQGILIEKPCFQSRIMLSQPDIIRQKEADYLGEKIGLKWSTTSNQ